MSPPITPFDPPTPSHEERIAHVVRRLGLGVHSEAVAAARSVDDAIATALDLSAPRPPLPTMKVPVDLDELTDMSTFDIPLRHWLSRMTTSDRLVEERLVWFWSDHLATGVRKVRSPYLLWQQHALIRRHATARCSPTSSARRATADRLGEVFRRDWDIMKVVEEIAADPAFTADRAVRSKVRTPIERLLGIFQGFPTNDRAGRIAFRALHDLGFIPFGPPNPAGFPSSEHLLDPHRLIHAFDLAGVVADPAPQLHTDDVLWRLGIHDVSAVTHRVVEGARTPFLRIALAANSPGIRPHMKHTDTAATPRPTRCASMSRREFLAGLGASTAVGLGGYLVGDLGSAHTSGGRHAAAGCRASRSHSCPHRDGGRQRWAQHGGAACRRAVP